MPTPETPKKCPNGTRFTSAHMPSDDGAACLACGLPLPPTDPPATAGASAPAVTPEDRADVVWMIDTLRAGGNESMADIMSRLLADRDRLKRERDAEREGRFETLNALALTVAARDKLQAFKDWTHQFLDSHGVPHHPPGTHGAAGCRIGDRMDWLMEKIAHLEISEKGRIEECQTLQARVAALEAECDMTGMTYKCGCPAKRSDKVKAFCDTHHSILVEFSKELRDAQSPPRATSGVPLNSSAVASGGVEPATGEEF